MTLNCVNSSGRCCIWWLFYVLFYFYWEQAVLQYGGGLIPPLEAGKLPPNHSIIMVYTVPNIARIRCMEATQFVSRFWDFYVFQFVQYIVENSSFLYLHLVFIYLTIIQNLSIGKKWQRKSSRSTGHTDVNLVLSMYIHFKLWLDIEISSLTSLPLSTSYLTFTDIHVCQEWLLFLITTLIQNQNRQLKWLPGGLG